MKMPNQAALIPLVLKWAEQQELNSMSMNAFFLTTFNNYQNNHEFQRDLQDRESAGGQLASPDDVFDSILSHGTAGEGL